MPGCVSHLVLPLFLPNISSTPSVRPDSSSYRDTSYKLCGHSSDTEKIKIDGGRQIKCQRTGYKSTTMVHANPKIRTTKNTKKTKQKGIPRMRQDTHNTKTTRTCWRGADDFCTGELMTYTRYQVCAIVLQLSLIHI